MYICYEWSGADVSNYNGMRRFLWTAQARGTFHHKVESSRRLFTAAHVSVQVSIAYKDIDRVWKQRGIDLANETLDNLVMLYAIQNQREFETEQRLNFVPDL